MRLLPLVLLPAVLAGAPAHAQVYKWVDERGVINYSNQLPVNPAAANKLAVVEDQVSVYTPDPALMQAVEAERRGGGVSARIAELERQLDAERRARQSAAAPPRPTDPCANRTVDCSGLSGPYYYTRPVVAVAPRLRPRPVPRIRPEPAMWVTPQGQSTSRPWRAATRPPRLDFGQAPR